MSRRPPRSAGFTLIEVLAVVALMLIVIGAATRFYIELSDHTETATERTQGSRRAAGILDRVARDLETALLVRKAEDADPLNHPWLFYAEPRGSGEGADRIKFVHRGRSPRATAVQESDVEMVAYLLRPGENDDFELWRWSSPHLPETLDRGFPEDDAEGALLLARDVASFGVRFLDEEGGWSDDWDSSTVARSGQLPTAAEITVALYANEDSEAEPETLVRRVLLPIRPFDFEELHGEAAQDAGDDEDDDEDEDDEEDGDEESDDEEESAGCVTVQECVNKFPGVAAQISKQYGIQLDANILSECASTYSGFLPISPDQCR